MSKIYEHAKSLLRLRSGGKLLFWILHKIMEVSSFSLLRRRANARNVSYTPYPTGDKHTISTLLIKPIFSVLAHAEKRFFSKLVFEC